jgi:hypothetical protein
MKGQQGINVTDLHIPIKGRAVFYGKNELPKTVKRWIINNIKYSCFCGYMSKIHI